MKVHSTFLRRQFDAQDTCRVWCRSCGEETFLLWGSRDRWEQLCVEWLLWAENHKNSWVGGGGEFSRHRAIMIYRGENNAY